MEIQGVDSVPEYINVFINSNMKDLLNIYDEGIKDNLGCLVLKCNPKENKMDVSFFNEEMIKEMIKKDDIIKHPEKKLFLVNDLDLNCIFLIYV